MILGGDYSKWDPILDWPNHTWKYAFIKVSEGIVEDKVFSQQWKSAKGYVYRGGYHFFRPLVSWQLAAEKFMQLMNRDGLGELPPVLDIEVLDGVANDAICERGLEWLQWVYRKSGKRPIVYTSPGFSNTVGMHRYQDYADYDSWQATYPWDTITSTWTEEMRRETILGILNGTFQYKFPNSARPWSDLGRRAVFVQFTGKCPPEYVPGYPLGVKLAVDVNMYRYDLDEMKFRYSLPELEGGNMSTKPITWTATLKAGQPANLRSAPGLGAGIIKLITGAPTPFQGTGTKVSKDNYYWGEVVLPQPGWIAFTTSFENVKWITEPPVPAPQKKAVKTVIHYDDGSSDEMFPK